MFSLETGQLARMAGRSGAVASGRKGRPFGGELRNDAFWGFVQPELTLTILCETSYCCPGWPGQCSRIQISGNVVASILSSTKPSEAKLPKGRASGEVE